MNLEESLLKEHSRAMADKVSNWVGTDPGRFSSLVNVFLRGPYRLTQRSAWPLSIAVERHPELVKPHLGKLVRKLSGPGLSDAVKRNTVRLLQYVDIPKRLHGEIVQICFGYLADRKQAIAVRTFALTVLERVAKANPGLERELKLVIEHQLPNASPAFRNRAAKVLKALS